MSLGLTGCPKKQVVKKRVVKVKTAEEYLSECLQKVETDTKASVQEAIPLCQKALSLKPSLNKAHYNLALAFERQKNYAKATMHMKKYIDSKPADAKKKRVKLADWYIKAGQADKAVGIYEAFLKEDDGNIGVMNNLAILYTRAKKFDAAEKMVQRVLAQDSRNKKAYQTLVLLCYKSGKLNQAIVVGQNALKEINKKDPMISNNLGMVYIKRKEYSKASEMFTQTLTFDANNLEAKLNLATIAIREGAWKIAVSRLEDVVAKRPKHLYANRTYAVALMGMKRLREAKKVYERLLKNKPNDPEALFQLGVIYFTAKFMRKQQKQASGFFDRYEQNADAKKLLSYKRSVAYIKQARARLKLIASGGSSKKTKAPKKRATPKPAPRKPEPRKEPAKTPADAAKKAAGDAAKKAGDVAKKAAGDAAKKATDAVKKAAGDTKKKADKKTK
jgi:tetratricopeptide (TPR) repeat protein